MLPQRLTLLQTQQQWASQLNPLLANPLLNGRLVEDVILISGTTLINHGLGRNLRGWFVVGINAVASIYDNQASNQTPQLTLSLTSSATVTVTLWVF